MATRKAAARRNPPRQQAPRRQPPRRPPPVEAESYRNPLEQAGERMLALVTEIRMSNDPLDIDNLKALAEKEINDFQSRALGLQVPDNVVNEAHYVLCATLDEAVLNTPWGFESGWRMRGLQAQFWANDVGGKRFFDNLERYLRDPANHLDILELMYLSLSLGFMGQFRALDNGKTTVEALRERVYTAIRQQRGEFERELSPQWEGEDTQRKIPRSLALWLVGSAVALLLLGVFLAVKISLESRSSNLAAQIQTLEFRPVNYAMPATPAPRDERVCFSLDHPMIEVAYGPDRATIRLLAGLFGSGSDRPNDPALVATVAALIREQTDRNTVVVEGHTDNVGADMYNFRLSQRRATSVAALLDRHWRGDRRLEQAGFGETQPRCSNDTPQGRACNRRVEITVMGVTEGCN